MSGGVGQGLGGLGQALGGIGNAFDGVFDSQQDMDQNAIRWQLSAQEAAYKRQLEQAALSPVSKPEQTKLAFREQLQKETDEWLQSITL